MAVLVTASPGLGDFLLRPSIMLLVTLVAFIGYYIAGLLYNIYLHPLRSFPGPWFIRGSRIPYSISQLSGRTPFNVLKWHKKYGSVVRIGPNELVFSDPRAWRDIMGHRSSGEPEFEKPHKIFRVLGQPTTIMNAPREEHGRLRRQLAHGFSDRSLREQQPIIKRYIDMMVQRLHESCEAGSKSTDMVKWYNYTTFDVIGDLAFGESFGCLESGQYHPWISMIFQNIKAGTWLQTAMFFPWIKILMLAITPKDMMKKRQEHNRLTEEKLLKRMNYGFERPDFIEGLLGKKDELGLSMPQLKATSSSLITAGSETTATLLSGVTYLLGVHPDALAKLTKEVRTAFRTEDEIDYLSVSNLSYMLACLDEALRLYPPAPLGIPRQTPKGGGNVAGYYVPEDTLVSVFHYAAYHDEKFWALADEFHPERWLGDPKFANDQHDIFQPFHIGPRNCLGKNLAYIEMRLILARVLWNFDMKLADESKNWIADQKIFLLWEKPPLNVYLTPRFQD
ncbi:hypothetical protein N0V93_006568 [Gnomoniopsis smithogilvyi]|uniref:Cytochrome P450 monooxygenase n=1 Tax=Gnomoniopsis smithogilvyi TaxID=1191159 RepID=A0A9W9CVQ5_9PEZI|nr:hypothetical protein N0V93_006568 [Gnomoniopsis smithogilvyi]